MTSLMMTCRSSFYPQSGSTTGSIVASWLTPRCCKPSVRASPMVLSPQCACKKTPAEKAHSLTLTARPSKHSLLIIISVAWFMDGCACKKTPAEKALSLTLTARPSKHSLLIMISVAWFMDGCAYKKTPAEKDTECKAK